MVEQMAALTAVVMVESTAAMMAAKKVDRKDGH